MIVIISEWGFIPWSQEEMIENGGRCQSIWRESLLTYLKCIDHQRDKDTFSQSLPKKKKVWPVKWLYVNGDMWLFE